MTGRASRRAVCALIGALLALSAVLPAPAASAPTGSPHGPAAVLAAARPAAPLARAAHGVYRMIGHAIATGSSPVTPFPAVTVALGLLPVAGALGQSRLIGDRRRPRGPPAPGPAVVA